MEHIALAGSTGYHSTLGGSFRWFGSRSRETTLKIPKSRGDGHALVYFLFRNSINNIVSMYSAVPLTLGVGTGLHVLWVPSTR